MSNIKEDYIYCTPNEVECKYKEVCRRNINHYTKGILPEKAHQVEPSHCISGQDIPYKFLDRFRDTPVGGER